MNNNTKAKITVKRLTIVGVPERYRIEKIQGPAEVEINAQTREQEDRTLTVGDELNHKELVRLCSVSVYDVTTLAPDRG